MLRLRFPILFLTFLLVTATTAMAAHGDPHESASAGMSAMKLKEQLTGKNKPYVVDARSLKLYKRGHIPGAINIPSPAVKMLGPARLPKDKSALIIFYGDGENYSDITRALNRATRMGYTNGQVFGGGILEWTTMHYPVRKGARP